MCKFSVFVKNRRRKTPPSEPGSCRLHSQSKSNRGGTWCTEICPFPFFTTFSCAIPHFAPQPPPALAIILGHMDHASPMPSTPHRAALVADRISWADRDFFHGGRLVDWGRHGCAAKVRFGPSLDLVRRIWPLRSFFFLLVCCCLNRPHRPRRGEISFCLFFELDLLIRPRL
jgi:hypothetical protein